MFRLFGARALSATFVLGETVACGRRRDTWNSRRFVLGLEPNAGRNGLAAVPVCAFRDACDRLDLSCRDLAMIADWRGFLDSAIREEELRDFREHARTGRPLGNAMFLDRLEASGRPRPPSTESRPPVKTTQTTIIGACPRNTPSGVFPDESCGSSIPLSSTFFFRRCCCEPLFIKCRPARALSVLTAS